MAGWQVDSLSFKIERVNGNLLDTEIILMLVKYQLVTYLKNNNMFQQPVGYFEIQEIRTMER